MSLQGKWGRAIAVLWLFNVAIAAVAFGQERLNTASLIAQLDPSVVTIKLDNGAEGSGFVVSSQGLIVTNYHVIEGAKQATVLFPDKRTFPVEGFAAYSVTTDVALLKIDPGAKKLTALSFARKLPEKGEQVFALGSPMGLSGSVSNGIVSAIRPGADMRDTLKALLHRDVYQEVLGYELKLQWIQTTAPISPGNSGGPLVNAHGEVIGMNTWVYAVGQNLNFSLAADHVRQVVSRALPIVQPLASLPPARPRPQVTSSHAPQEHRGGDGQTTLTMWNELNALRADLRKKSDKYHKSLQAIVPMNVRNPAQGAVLRNKRKAAIYGQMAKTYGDYAAKIKELNTVKVDVQVLFMSVAEADLAQRASDACQQLADALANNTGAFRSDWHLTGIRQNEMMLRTKRDILRVQLSRLYNVNFPATADGDAEEETTADATENAGENAAVDDAVSAADQRSDSTTVQQSNHEKPAAPRLDTPRTWTDRSGQFRVVARCLGVENGKARLEKDDGKVVSVALDALSDADREFIKQAQ